MIWHSFLSKHLTTRFVRDGIRRIMFCSMDNKHHRKCFFEKNDILSVETVNIQPSKPKTTQDITLPCMHQFFNVLCATNGLVWDIFGPDWSVSWKWSVNLSESKLYIDAKILSLREKNHFTTYIYGSTQFQHLGGQKKTLQISCIVEKTLNTSILLCVIHLFWPDGLSAQVIYITTPQTYQDPAGS